MKDPELDAQEPLVLLGTQPIAARRRLLFLRLAGWLFPTLGAVALGSLAFVLWSAVDLPRAGAPASAPLRLDGVSDDIQVRRPPVDDDPAVRGLDGARYDDGSPTWGAERPLPPLRTTIDVPPPSRAARDPFGAYNVPVRAARPSLGKLPDLQKNLLPSGRFQLTKTFLPASNFVRLQALPPRRAKTDKMRS